jgi:hypothetical protein
MCQSVSYVMTVHSAQSLAKFSLKNLRATRGTGLLAGRLVFKTAVYTLVLAVGH